VTESCRCLCAFSCAASLIAPRAIAALGTHGSTDGLTLAGAITIWGQQLVSVGAGDLITPLAPALAPALAGITAEREQQQEQGQGQLGREQGFRLSVYHLPKQQNLPLTSSHKSAAAVELKRFSTILAAFQTPRDEIEI
jgi:hypothetical protein